MARGDLRAVVCTSDPGPRHRLGQAVDIVIQLAAAPRAPRAWCSASAAPTTGSTSPPAPCWCRPAASRCWSARPHARPWPRTVSTATRSARARSTCWPSTMGVAWWRAVRSGRSSMTRSGAAAPYADSFLGRLRAGGRFRLHRRLCALKAYDRYRRIVKTQDGRWTVVRDGMTALRHRMNVGAIVGPATLNLRLYAGKGRAGRKIGEVEEGYIEQLPRWATPSSSAVRCGGCRASRASTCWSARRRGPSPRCRAGAAPSSRCPPTSPSGCGA